MTHPTDFRSLCARVLKAEELILPGGGDFWKDHEEEAQALSRLMCDIRAALAVPQQGAPSNICTGCDTPRHEAITAIANGAMACCPDCSTLTVEDRNAIRAIKAVPVADAVAAERFRWFKAVEWALGTGDSDFTPPDVPHGKYWWRKELAERCGIRWDGTKWVDAEALPLPEAQP